MQFSSDKLSQLQQETKKDNDLSTLRDFIVDGWPDSMKEIPTQLRQYWSYREELSVENGMLLKCERIVIPRSMQQDILQQVYAGHLGCYAWTETMTLSRTIYVRRDFHAKIAIHERWQLNVMNAHLFGINQQVNERCHCN